MSYYGYNHHPSICYTYHRPVLATNAKNTSGPATEPITTATAKAHLRIDHNDEDDDIDRLIEVARQQCEGVANRAFIERTMTATLDYWPHSGVIELPYPPLSSVTTIEYTDEDGATSTWASSNYIVDTQNEPGRIVFKSDSTLPTDALQEVNGITITYVAGYGTDTDDVPSRYKQAMLLWIGHLYENREAVIAEPGAMATEMPLTIQSMLLTDRGGW